MFCVLTYAYTPCCQKVPSFLCTWPPLFGDFWQFWKGVSASKGDFRVSKKHSFLAFHKNAKTDYGRKRRLDDKKDPLFWSKRTPFLDPLLGSFWPVFGLSCVLADSFKKHKTSKITVFWTILSKTGPKRHGNKQTKNRPKITKRDCF